MRYPSPTDIAYMSAHAGDDRRSWYIGINVVCLVLGILAVGSRFISRKTIGAKIGFDDVLIAVATVLLIGTVSCNLVSVRYGMGRHEILVENAKGFAMSTLVGQSFYNLCISVTKLSILSLYGRVFNRAAGWFFAELYVTALIVFLYTIPQVFTYIFRCVPIDSLWTVFPPVYRVYCLNFQAVIISFGVINIVTDWWILLVPVPIVLGLNLDKRTKQSIVSLFLVGGFVCVVSIIRLVYARHIETSDTSWYYTPITAISAVECSTGIFAACMPTFRPLFKFMRKGMSSFLGSPKTHDHHPSRPTSRRVNNHHTQWNFLSRRQSQAISKNRSGTLKIDHGAMGVGRLGAGLGITGGPKRSEARMSGGSAEKMLKDMTAVDIELSDTNSSPSLSPYIGSRSPSKSPHRSPRFR